MSLADNPDPENLTNADRPAVVDVEDGRNVFVASAKVRDNGWLWLKQWDGQTFKLPPQRVQAVQRIQKERYGEADSEGFKPQRIADEGWRRRAMEMNADAANADEHAQAVLGDD